MNALVLTARDGPLTTLTLNRPDKRNALNVDLLEQLAAAIASAENENSQRVLIVRGAGSVFCAGLDLTEAAQSSDVHASADRVSRVLRALSETRLVTIAAVHGAAIAGGAGLMSACDIAVATRDARFGFPEVQRGLVPALIMTFLRRQLHERDARELLILGETITADRAHAMGLINRVVVDDGALETEVRAVVNSVLKGAPGAVAQTKAVLASLWPKTIADDLGQAIRAHVSARDSGEAREGLRAFVEKRPPDWGAGPERRS